MPTNTYNLPKRAISCQKSKMRLRINERQPLGKASGGKLQLRAGMKQHTEAEYNKRKDDYMEDEAAEKRWPLLMIPKDNDYDPDFPAMFYRKGKYVTMEAAQHQQHLEYMSKTLYGLCVEEKREDALQCYKEKCAMFRAIMGAMQPKKGS